MTSIGIFGGTFDPIHFGHLRTAFELLQALRLNEIRFMPAGNPPHREVTVASPAERYAMVKAAIAGQPGFVVDDREIRREGLSYSVDTMRTLRAGSWSSLESARSRSPGVAAVDALAAARRITGSASSSAAFSAESR